MIIASDRDQRRMYGDLAWVWPIMSNPGEYVHESERFAALIKQYAQIQTRTLLNLGCGGGNNDNTLKKHFEVTGTDISEGMLANAKRLNPEVRYLAGDMRTLRLGETFDAVVVFDSISYMQAESELLAVFQTAFEHLKPGGAFVTYQENDPRTFKQNAVRHQIESKANTELVFIENYYDPDPADTTIEGTFLYLIRKSGELHVEMDRHVLGIFPRKIWLTLLRKTGFHVKVLEGTPEECTAFVCMRPQ